MNKKATVMLNLVNLFSKDKHRGKTLRNKFKGFEFKFEGDMVSEMIAPENFDEDKFIKETLPEIFKWALNNARSKKLKDEINTLNDIEVKVAPKKEEKVKVESKTIPKKEVNPQTGFNAYLKDIPKRLEPDKELFQKVYDICYSKSEKEMEEYFNTIKKSFASDKRMYKTIQNIDEDIKDIKLQGLVSIEWAFRRAPKRLNLQELYAELRLIKVSKKEAPVKKASPKKKAEVKSEAKISNEPKAKTEVYLARYNPLPKAFQIHPKGLITTKDLEKFPSKELVGPDFETLKDFVNNFELNASYEIEFISKNLNELIVTNNHVLTLFKLIKGNNSKNAVILEKFNTVFKDHKWQPKSIEEAMVYGNITTFGNKSDAYFLNRRLLWEYIKVTVNEYDRAKNVKAFAFFVYPFVIPYYNYVNGLYKEEVKEIKNEQKEEAINYTIDSNTVSFIFDNERFVINRDDSRFNDVTEAVKSNNKEKLNSLIETKKNLAEKIQNVLSSVEDEIKDIKIVDKKIICNGVTFVGPQAMKLIGYITDSDINGTLMFKRFLYNLSLNPETRAQEELYNFVISNKLAITPAGTILLYKWVRSNYKDEHSGTFDNSPGKTVWMQRQNVDNDKYQTCSKGLHLCSFGYTKFSSNLLLVELHPRDCVSIPVDYNSSKMRCCEYKVLMDVTEFYNDMQKKGDFISTAKEIHFNPLIIEKQIMEMYPNVARIHPVNKKLSGFTYQQALENKLFDYSKENLVEVIEEKFENSVELDEEEVVEEVKDTFEIYPLESETISLIREEWSQYISGKKSTYQCSLLLNPELFINILINAKNIGIDHIILNEAVNNILPKIDNIENIANLVSTKKVTPKLVTKSKIFDILLLVLSLSRHTTSVVEKEAEHTKSEKDSGIEDSKNHESDGIFGRIGNFFKKLF